MASAYVSKSKKGFQPKAPIRRAAVQAPASTQASTRNSVDRQTQFAVRDPTPAPSRVVASLSDVPHGAVAVLVPPNQAETTNINAAKDVANASSITDSEPHLEPRSALTENERPVSILPPQPHSTPLDSNATNSAVSHNPPINPTVPSPLSFKQASSNLDQSRRTSEPQHDLARHTPNQTSRQADQPNEYARSPSLARHSPEQTSQSTLPEHSQPLEEAPQSSKRACRSSHQANQPIAELRETSPAEVQEQLPKRARRTTRKLDVQSGGTGEEPIATKRRKTSGNPGSIVHKRGKATASTSAGESQIKKSRGQGRRERKKKQRSLTPEDAENFAIEEDTVRMEELCSERRTGKKSVLSEEIQAFEAAEAERRAVTKARQLAGEEPLESENQSRLAGPEQEPEGAMLAPETQIVNGEIVLIEDSTRIDRHAMADAQREAEAVVVVEENALTTRVNSHYNLKRTSNQRWTDDDTEEFYNALKMFGTDFEIISKMFPTRSRRQIKLKYTHEEKVNQARISQTLHGERIPVNIEEFSEWTETTYADPAILHAEMEADRKALEEEQAKEKELIEEERRQREAETAAEAAAVGADTSAKENEEQDADGTGIKSGKTKKRGNTKTQKGKKSQTRKGRNLVNLGGGQVEVLGRIEDNIHHQPPEA